MTVTTLPGHDLPRSSHAPRLLRERGYHATVVLETACVLVMGGLGSDWRTVHDTAEMLCPEPEARPTRVVVREDVPTSIQIEGTSAFGPPSVHRIVSPPTHGSLAGVPPDLVFTPEAEFSGRDEFAFVTLVGSAESPRATATVGVAPVDDPPVAAW